VTNSLPPNPTEKEKVVEPLAQAVAAGIEEAGRQALSGTAAAACIKMESTSLRVLLKAAEWTGIGFRFEAGISGGALFMFANADLARIGGLLAGREVGAGEAPGAEAMEACLRFCAHALEASGQSFAQSYGLTIHATAPELINADGRSATLVPLADSYADAVCLTFEVTMEGCPDCRILLLAGADLRSSLQAQLPGYAAVASNTSPAARHESPPPGGGNAAGETPRAKWNMDLILDVELEVAVSFGETEMSLRDILKLGVGSVIELDKAVNDPVAILVNQKPIACGEVVMVDGNYGVKVLEVESTADRIRSLG
jgi:flagellar motor switch protein FliN